METNNKRARVRAKKTKMRLPELLPAAVLLGGIALLLTLFLLVPDREFSDQENRKLAQRPEFSLSALADGSFYGDLGDYLADQFPGRDAWVGMKAGSQYRLPVFLCHSNCAWFCIACSMRCGSIPIYRCVVLALLCCSSL